MVKLSFGYFSVCTVSTLHAQLYWNCPSGQNRRLQKLREFNITIKLIK
jgi:hypothetical protein